MKDLEEKVIAAINKQLELLDEAFKAQAAFFPESTVPILFKEIVCPSKSGGVA